MPRKTTAEIQELFKQAFEKRKGNRTSGWTAEDSAFIAMEMLNAQTDKTGKAIKLAGESLQVANAALQITPQGIVTVLAGEVEKAGGSIDETSKGILLRILDVQAFRHELVAGEVLEKAPKGKKRKSLVDLLK